MATAKNAKVSAIAEFRKMDKPALVTKIAELRKELVEQHRANKAGELPSAAVITKTRKEIAKALTVLAEQATDAQVAEPQEQEK